MHLMIYLLMYFKKGIDVHRHHQEFSFFEERGRHGHFGGRGRPFDRMGGGFMGAGIRAAKMLASGDLRLIILALLSEKPRHGYEIIKAIEEHSSGVYSPSPGMVYPALTYLEELGYAASESDGTKKLFRITEAGTAHLNENRASVEETLEQLARFGRKVSEFQKRFTEEDEEGEEGEEAEADAEVEDEAGDEEAPKPAKKVKKKAPAAPKRTRVAKVVRMKAVWVVYDNSSKQIETFPFSQRSDAEALVEQKNTDKKGACYLQMVKVPFEEK